MAYKQKGFPMHSVSALKQRFGTQHHEETSEVLKRINPVIQTGKFLVNSPKSTDKALKKEAKDEIKGIKKTHVPKY